MQKITEDSIEKSFIEQLVETHKYEYFYGPEISPTSENPQRENYSSVLLEKHLKESLRKLNPDVPESARAEAFQKIRTLGGGNDIMENNEKFHIYLTEGITVEYFQNGESSSEIVKLIDIQNPENNSFWAVNQFIVQENNNEKRFDVVIFVNGMPLVFVELKNANDEKATLQKAFTQIQNYKNATPSIFYYNALCIISDGIDARTSSLSAPFSRYLAWKNPEENSSSSPKNFTELQIMTEKMLKKSVVLNLIRYNTVFESDEKKDENSGLITKIKIKKVAAYHQYYAVEKAVTQTLRATNAETGDRKIGVVWHTQGSGKSLSMVFYTGRIVVEPQMKNPTIIILTDRNDLDDQLFSTFGNCIGLLRQTPEQAHSRAELKKLLKRNAGGIIFTTLQKFSADEGKNIFDTLSERKNIVVVADEAHRSQYGFSGKISDETGELKYGNAKYLRDALPNASFLGFTGTPIEEKDRNTKNVFGEYIDVYDIAQAVKDGATVPISYESRLIKIKMDRTALAKIDYAVDEVLCENDEQREDAKKKNAQINAIIGNEDRLKDVATDIVSHFEMRQSVFEGKGMIVAMTREIAVKLYSEIIKLRPSWHSDDLDSGKIKVVMTSSTSDPENFQPHHTSKKDRKNLALRIKDAHDPLQLVIVQSMWLTGFDAPSLHTMYIDKKMKGANLMQAIARVNRVYKDKPAGLIVDYIGIGQDLKNAMATYIESGGTGESVVDMKTVIRGLLEKFEIVEQMFFGYDYKKYFSGKISEKLQIILETANFILEDENKKNRFLAEVSKLSQLLVMAFPSDEAEKIKDEVAFFQAIKTRIQKFSFSGSGEKSDFEVQTAIKQIVDDALSSEGVIDIFEAAGVKSPSVSILSHEFLQEVKNMKQKNIAFELLKKLINDEVNIRKTQDIIQGKKFSEMLTGVITRYHNNQIDTAQVIEELSQIATEMNLEDEQYEKSGLVREEYAFYKVLKENSSTSFLNDEKMKELIHVITETIRKNATVDWSQKRNVRAKLRLTVKKILIKYGYPPDLARMQADKVLNQGELLAENF